MISTFINRTAYNYPLIGNILFVSQWLLFINSIGFFLYELHKKRMSKKVKVRFALKNNLQNVTEIRPLLDTA